MVHNGRWRLALQQASPAPDIMPPASNTLTRPPMVRAETDEAARSLDIVAQWRCSAPPASPLLSRRHRFQSKSRRRAGGEPDGAAPVSTADCRPSPPDRAAAGSGDESPWPIRLQLRRRRSLPAHRRFQPGDSEAATTGFNNGLAQQAER